MRSLNPFLIRSQLRTTFEKLDEGTIACLNPFLIRSQLRTLKNDIGGPKMDNVSIPS